MKRVLLLIFLMACSAAASRGQVINAATCNASDVQTALNSVAADGTTVNVPAGTCTWSSTISYTANFSVIIQGQSTTTGTCAPGGTCSPSDNTVIQDAAGGAALHVTSVNGKSLRVTGFTFSWLSGAQQFVGMLFIDGGSQSVRVDHCHFVHANIVDLTVQSNSTAGNIYGVVDHNMFNTGSSNEDAMRVEHYNWNGSSNMVGYGQGGGEGSWTDSAHFGSGQFVFVENNTFAFDGANTTHAFAFDCDAGGGRMVFRFNNVTPNMALQTHGTGSGDANFRGCRALELYGNNFAYVATTNTFQALEWETSSLMAWGNTWSNYTQVFQLDYVRSTNATYSQSATPNGWGYCATSPIGGVAGPSTWDVSGSGPCVDQIGRGAGDLVHGTFPSKVDTVTNTITWPNQATEPSYLWGNTLTSVNHYVVHFASGSINENTDYFTERPNIDNSATFNGTQGIGCGPAAGTGCSNPIAQPSTCTQGVGYWNPATSILSVCNGSNTFVASYTPYTYPHPLTQIGQGWKFLQDSPLIFCQGASRTNCSPGLGNIIPTVAGSVWILQSQSPNNVTIASINGGSGGGTWIHCTACHVTNPSGLTADVWYNLTGSAGFNGANPFSFTLSGNAGAFFGANFVELLPPPGTTASFDTAGTATPIGCTTCTAASPGTLTGTDAIWINPGGGPNATWHSWSAPYITTSNGSGVCLNCASGTAPTNTFGSPNQNPEFVAMAFKSSAGTFTVPAKQYSIANFTAVVPATACNVCTIPIPTTTAGHLLYLEAANEAGNFISSVSGGTWVIPTACQGKQTVQGQNNTLSCAYNLSAVGGTTSLTVSMQGGVASQGFAVTEIATTGTTFSLDFLGTTFNTPNASCSGYCFPGQPLALSSTNDVAFQVGWIVGQNPTGPNYYAQPTIPTTSQGAQGPGSFNAFFAQNASIAILTDTGPSPPTPTWINAVANQNTMVTGAAFTSSGSAPAPPAVTLTPATLNMGNQTVNTTTSVSQSVTLTNSGGSSLTITSITLTGANSADFSIAANTCSTSLSANASCVVSLTFTPSAAGARSASLTFTTNAATSPDNDILSGTGVLSNLINGAGTISGSGSINVHP